MKANALLAAGIVLLASACASTAPAPNSSANSAAIAAPPAVFFVKGSADLNISDGQDVIRETAAKAMASNVGRLVVTGYADTYGPVNYNVVLAQKRADAVKAALVADGVTKPIDTHAASAQEHFDIGMAGDHGIADRRATILLVPTGGAAVKTS